jgi:hypothetical protein
MSENLLSTGDLNQYINTFVLYDFPEHLRLLNLRTTFEFVTQPYQDVYVTNPTNTNDPLYDFDNQYITVNQPVYVAGFQALFMESRQQFYGIYPLLNSIASIGVAGNGSTTSFSGVINTNQALVPPNVVQTLILLKNNVLFSSVDSNYNGLALQDYPISASIGNLFVPGGAPTSTTVQDPNNYVNYITGQFTITFPTAPGTGQAINSQTVPLQPSMPQSVLFYDGSFVLRPVPDQPYTVNMEVFARPTALLASGQNPQLNEWWQFIAYGAAIKVFQDRSDLDSVEQIMPEFQKQMDLINRRTIVQQTSQRSTTIYTQDHGAAGAYGPGWFASGGQF